MSTVRVGLLSLVGRGVGRRVACLLISSALLAHAAAAQFTQQGNKLTGPHVSRVAISADGNTVILGEGSDDSGVGAAWVYTRSAGAWSQQGNKLVGTGAIGASQQGGSVAISGDGNTVIVGGPGDDSRAGAAWVYTRSGGVWSQQGDKLVGTGAGPATPLGAQQGKSVAISADGTTVIVGGAYDDSGVGAAWVFTRSGGVWSQQGSKLVGTGAVGATNQGFSVAISADGNTAIVGGHRDASEVGAVWVFTRSNGVWSQQGSKLVGSDVGSIPGAGVWLGKSMAISADGNTAIVGGPNDGGFVGAAWVFTRSGGVWSQQGSKLVGADASTNVMVSQGISVGISADGGTAIFGGPNDNSNAGATWVFTRSGGVWSQQGSKLVGTGAIGASQQGWSVAISGDGNTVIVDGPADDSSAGAVWVFATGHCTAPAISGQPQSQSIQSGQTATLSVTATGTAPLSYQWYEGASGDTSQPVGTDASSFTTPALTATTSYWVRVSDACGPADSATATITIAAVPNVYVVSASAHTSGAASSNWVSDVVIHNPGAAPATATLRFLKKGQDNSGATGVDVSVPAGASVRLGDVVKATFAESKASGALLIRSDAKLLVTSRTYNNASSGTYGQYVEGYPATQAIGTDEAVRLIQLTRSSVYRTNIGFANAAAGELGVLVALYRADGSSLGTRTVTVPPYGYAQEDDIFAKLGVTSAEDAYAVVSSSTPNAAYFTYASVIDGRTNDPVQVVPVGRDLVAGAGSGVGALAPFREAAPTPVTSGIGAPIRAGTAARVHALDDPVAVVSHFAGSAGGPGSADGTGSAARFYFPEGVAVDGTGTIYVADTENHTIRKITQDGTVSTRAGKAGEPGSADGAGDAARFYGPSGIAIDGTGNLYVADSPNHTIRKITPEGAVTTVAGTAGQNGSEDGSGSTVRFNSPRGVALDSAGNLFVADVGNNTIRKITPAGIVTTLAGKAGSSGSADGAGAVARFNQPSGVTVDGSGNVYVTDRKNYTIRKVTPGGTVTTLAGKAGSYGSTDGAGSAARFFNPSGVAVDGTGTIYVADKANQAIRKVTPAGIVTTLAGKAGSSGSADGVGTAARFYDPLGVAVDGSGNLYVADTTNCAIREITPGGTVATLAGLAAESGSADGAGSAARFNWPDGISADSAGNVFVADTYNHTIRKITPDGTVSTLAGKAGEQGSADGPGTVARFNRPYGIAVDTAGNAYVVDRGNETIRKVAPDGTVTTLAGAAGEAGSADGTGGAARFERAWGIAADGAGTLYVADFGNNTIRKITAAGVVTTLAGMAGERGSADGTGSAARFYNPAGITADGAGILYVADWGNNTIREITPDGTVTTLAGLAGSTGSSDGTGNAARFGLPTGIAADVAGNLYVADNNNQTIRRVTPAAVVSTLAGLAGVYGSDDGVGSTARFFFPAGVALVGSRTLFVADMWNNAIRKVSLGDCTFSLDPSSASLPAAGGIGGVAVTTDTDCAWTATSDSEWLTITSAASGAGSGTVSYAVEANASPDSRTGTITIGGVAFTVTQAGFACAAPSAPVPTAPATAVSDETYALSWTATSADGTYELQQSTDSAFAGADTVPVSGLTASASHTATAATTWYARVRAVEVCGGVEYRSDWSNTAQTVISPPQPSGAIVYLPAASRVTGVAGTNWRTDLEVHNPGSAQARFTLELLKKDKDNSSALSSTFTLDGGHSTRYLDVLGSAAVGFNHSGSGTLRITPYSGSVMATSRTYNDQPTGTFGQFIPGQPETEAISYGQEARLIQLSQSATTGVGFRTNVGFVNLTGQAIDVEAKLYRGDGTYIATRTVPLRAFEYVQVDAIFTKAGAGDVPDGFAVLRTTTTGGAFLAYASVIDNRSGDPIYIPARVVEP